MGAKKSYDDVIIEAEARDWIVKKYSGDFSLEEQSALSVWLRTSSRHQLAFAEQEQFWLTDLSSLESAFLAADEHEPPQAFQSTHSRSFVVGRTRFMALAAIAACILVVGGLFTLRFLPGGSILYETRAGEIMTVELEDGTSLSLDAQTRVSVSYSENERHLDLLAGAVFLDVTRDVDWPLRVESGPALIEVLGTEFSVEKSEDITWVGVQSGRVVASIGSQSGEAQSVVLAAGESVQLGAGEGAIRPVELDRSKFALWRDGLIEIDSIPLNEALVTLNRYYAGSIVLEGVAGPFDEVSGVFHIDRIEDAVTGLAATHDLQIERRNGNLFLKP